MNLEDYLKQQGIWYRISEKPTTIHTADASKVTGIPLDRITKSLVFKADGEPILAVLPGDKKIDVEKLAKAVKARKVKLASFEEAERLSGYPPGGTPPVYHHNIGKVVFDDSLSHLDTIFGGGGSRDRLIELKMKDALKLTDGMIADIIE